MKYMKKLLPILCGLLPILLLAGFLVFLVSTLFIPGPGGLYSPDSTQLDMRDQKLSVRQYQRLQEKLPDTEIRWNVPIGDTRVDSNSIIVHVTQLSEKDIPSFAYFRKLRQVNGTRSESYDALMALQEAYPRLDVRWGVDFGNKTFSQGCETLLLDTSDVTVAELTEKLAWMPNLKTLTLSGTVDAQSQAALMKRYPDIVFNWNVNLCGKTFRSTDKVISFEGISPTEANLATIRDGLFRFYNLEAVDFTGCGFDSDRLAKFRKDTGVEIGWDFDLCGVTVHSLDTEIDLSGHQIGLTDHVEEALP